VTQFRPADAAERLRGGDERRLALGSMTVQHASFGDRVAAAAAAGLRCIGYHHRHYRRDVRSGATDADLVAAAAAHGIEVVEVESVHGVLEADPDGRTSRFVDEMLRMVDVFGARRVIVHSGFDGDVDRAAARFARLCDRAAEHAVAVGLEFVPWTTLPDLRTVLDIVRAAGCANGGVVLDTWHFFRGDGDVAALSELRPGELVAVQLTDGVPEPRLDPLVETLTRRCPPGDGIFPLAQLVDALAHAEVPWSIEVICPDLDRLPVEEAVRRCVTACTSLLAGWSGRTADERVRATAVRGRRSSARQER